MYHSITIQGYNTYDEWGLIPMKRPHVAQPPLKSKYVDIPAFDGEIDYTEVLTGRPAYGMREGSWEFWLRPQEEWPNVYGDILQKIHGKNVNIILEDDPEWFYTGRVTVESFDTEDHNSKITIQYHLDPYKYQIDGSTGNIDWLWDDLFDNIIYYGLFDVEEEKTRNLINPVVAKLIPTFTLSAPMTVEFKGQTFSLPMGDNVKNDLIVLDQGNNVMVFKGNGRVKVDYSLKQI